MCFVPFSHCKRYLNYVIIFLKSTIWKIFIPYHFKFLAQVILIPLYLQSKTFYKCKCQNALYCFLRVIVTVIALLIEVIGFWQPNNRKRSSQTIQQQSEGICVKYAHQRHLMMILLFLLFSPCLLGLLRSVYQDYFRQI